MIFVLLLIAQIGIMIKLPITNHVTFSLLTNVILSLLLMICAASFVGLIAALDALVRAKGLARNAGLTIGEYVNSDSYRLQGRERLKRTDKERPIW